MKERMLMGQENDSCKEVASSRGTLHHQAQVSEPKGNISKRASQTHKANKFVKDMY